MCIRDSIQKATEAQDEVSKASKDKKVDPSPRLTRALQEILETQDAAQDIYHQSNKLYKFKKQDGEPATVAMYKSAATTVKDQISILLADAKSLRPHIPKVAKTDDEKKKK